MSETPSGPRQRLTSLRGLLPFLRPHRTLVVGWLLALAVSSGSMLTLPWAFRQVVDQISHGRPIDRWFIVLFGVAVIAAFATGARFFFVSLLGERVIADLRRSLYSHLLSLDQSFFERTRSGELISRLAADAELLRSVVGSSMPCT